MIGPSGEEGPRGEERSGFASETIELANEYAVVHVRRVYTRNGVRLEVSTPRLGTSIRLDPLELESLTWQTHETFSAFLETPFGPQGDGE
jgi:hypothetical protein